VTPTGDISQKAMKASTLYMVIKKEKARDKVGVFLASACTVLITWIGLSLEPNMIYESTQVKDFLGEKV
jgi:hypothetical protein